MPEPSETLTATVDWIAADWGTSTLRVWAMAADGSPLAEASSAQGMASLTREQYEPALLALCGGWLAPGQTIPVIACGMVGARQGWVEAPYTATPCAPLAAEHCIAAPISDPRLAVRIIPGLKQLTPPDVMRGEETQIAGFLAQHPGFEGSLCLPGTHTKWVEITAGQVQSFRTMMTGELFALLSQQSVLKHSLAEGWDDTAFATAFDAAITEPETLASRLFSLRAASLVGAPDAVAARATLSGWLIGAEFAAVPLPQGPVAVIGAAALARLYRQGLHQVGQRVIAVDAAAVTLQGLTQAYRAISQDQSS
jgi:2-dehydro-3-deoxygalactonokinase